MTQSNLLHAAGDSSPRLTPHSIVAGKEGADLDDSIDDGLLPQRAREASLALCVLGSGSGGNCSVIRWAGSHPDATADALSHAHASAHADPNVTPQPPGAALVDAGFGPVTIAKRLRQAGLSLNDIRAVFVTHLDQDHFRPSWIRTLVGYRIPLVIDRLRVDDVMKLPFADKLSTAGLIREFDDNPFECRGLAVSPIRLAHDQKGVNGFRFEREGVRLGYATDLGHAPKALTDLFAGVEMLAIESNYDPPMQLKSGRPLFLKRRVMGRAGHLSNEQAFEAVLKITEKSPPANPQHVVLLHRSQQCNCPTVIDAVFRQAPHVHRRIRLTEQRRRSRWFTATAMPQVQHKQLMFRF